MHTYNENTFLNKHLEKLVVCRLCLTIDINEIINRGLLGEKHRSLIKKVV